MNQTESRDKVTLPRLFIFFGEIAMIGIWAVLAFWAVIFIAYGFIEIGSLFRIDQIYGLISMIIGLLLLLQVINNVNKTKTIGLQETVVTFINKRFPEIVATSIFMVCTAFIITNDIYFILTNILIIPLIFGSTLSLTFGLFIQNILFIPLGPQIVFISTWLLQIAWMYFFSKIVVKIIYAFNLRSNVD